MELTQIRALDKILRSGGHLVIDLVPGSGESGYWMRASIDGAIVADAFTSPVQRNASPVAGLPHVISIPFGTQWKPVGLTGAEADGIDAAKLEWNERPARAARQAAPGAPAREVEGFTTPPVPGTIIELADGPAMVLGTASKRWIAEDGRSFNLDAESGYLFTALVRDLTEAEAGARFTGRI